MLAVVTAPPAQDRPLVGWLRHLRLGQRGFDRVVKFGLEGARIGHGLPGDHFFQAIIDLEQFGDETPAPVESLRHAPRAFLGHVAQSDGPVAGELAVISDFLDRLAGIFAQEFVGALREVAVKQVLPRREQQLPRDGLCEIAIGLLDQQAILEVEHVAVKRQIVRIAVVGMAKKMSRLAD